MTWLHNLRANSREVADSVANDGNAVKSLASDKYFEFDDDTTGVDIDGYLFFPKQAPRRLHSHPYSISEGFD